MASWSAGDELVALQLHLPAGQVERGDDLQVGRGRGVGEERLLERLLDRGEVVVGDQMIDPWRSDDIDLCTECVS